MKRDVSPQSVNGQSAPLLSGEPGFFIYVYIYIYVDSRTIECGRIKNSAGQSFWSASQSITQSGSQSPMYSKWAAADAL